MKFIAVHGGAGYISPSATQLSEHIKHTLSLSCSTALHEPSTSTLSMVDTSISILENDPWFNAGYGSNLTLDGTVECDASIMQGGDEAFGGVGAVSGLKSPIKLARLILEQSRIEDVAVGRIPPLTLVSHGAHSFAQSHQDQGMAVVPPESLIHDGARRTWESWMKRVHQSENDNTDPNTDTEEERKFQDTVGAVALIVEGGGVVDVSAGVSSGGILLKHPGRIGEAATYGAGCYASSSPTRKVAISISGTGECIMRSSLARRIADRLLLLHVHSEPGEEEEDIHGILENSLIYEFWNPNRKWTKDPQVGVILLVVDMMQDGEDPPGIVARLWCAFIAPTMSIAWGSTTTTTTTTTNSAAEPEIECDILRQVTQPERYGEPIVDITSIRVL